MVFKAFTNKVSTWYKNTFSRDKNEQKAPPREVSADNGVYGKKNIDTDALRPRVILSKGELMYRLLNGESKPLEDIAAEKGLNLTGQNGDLAQLAYGDNQYVNKRKGVLDLVVKLATQDDYTISDIQQEKINLKKAATLLGKQFKIYKNSKNKDIFDISDADWQHAYDAIALKSQQLHANDTSKFSEWHRNYKLGHMHDTSKERFVFFDKEREFDFDKSKKDIKYLTSLFLQNDTQNYPLLFQAARQHLSSIDTKNFDVSQDQLKNYQRFIVLFDAKKEEMKSSGVTLSEEESQILDRARSNFVKCYNFLDQNSGKHRTLGELARNNRHLNGNTLSVLSTMERLVGQIDVANPNPRLIDDIQDVRGLHRRAENYLRENSRAHDVDSEGWEKIYALGERLRTLESILGSRKDSEELVLDQRNCS
tara:strand:- start:441 stop:1709 length:1269 start_codon:yes stop_codon:yes gene_type:complete